MVCHKSLQIVCWVFTNQLTTNCFSFSKGEKKTPQIFSSSVEKCSCLKHIIFYGEGTRGEKKEYPKEVASCYLDTLQQNVHFHISPPAVCAVGCVSVKYYTCTQCSFFLCSFNQLSLLVLDVWRMCALPSSKIGTQQGVQLNLSGEQTRGKTNTATHTTVWHSLHLQYLMNCFL